MRAAKTPPPHGVKVTIGGLSRDDLRDELSSRGILLNRHAETLLAGSAFNGAAAPQRISVVERTLADLDLSRGAPLSQVFARAEGQGLRLCPLITGPYLRLAMTEQQSARDTLMSSGRAPSGSITVASRPEQDDDEYPKGFYLRVVGSRAWLRGYTCDDEHLWSPQDRFAFQLPS